MFFQKGGCAYILTNQYHNVFYVGVTSELEHRIPDHVNKRYPNSFTARYNCTKPVWYEVFPQIGEAIDREKQLKAGNRAKKINLINSMNPLWNDLWETDVQYW